MPMRDYEDLKNLKIPAEQERIMDIICDAWEECRATDCQSECKDNQVLPCEHILFACTALKYSRKIHEAGYAPAKWIDVSDRLPKRGTAVLVVTAPGSMSVGRNIVVAEYIHPMLEPNGAFVMGYIGKYDILTVTHWMPLPEPPEEGGTNV